jgi:hypothetical protein
MVILFDQFNLPESIYDIIFSTKQQVIVAKELIKKLKESDGFFTKPQMSQFATSLHEGAYETELEEPQYKGKKVKLSYNKRQFYDRILTPMRSMGLIEYDMYKRIYKLSDKFNKMMLKIGTMWVNSLRKPAIDFESYD